MERSAEPNNNHVDISHCHQNGDVSNRNDDADNKNNNNVVKRNEKVSLLGQEPCPGHRGQDSNRQKNQKNGHENKGGRAIKPNGSDPVLVTQHQREKTRRTSVTDPGKHSFTVVNYGNKSLKQLKPLDKPAGDDINDDKPVFSMGSIESLNSTGENDRESEKTGTPPYELNGHTSPVSQAYKDDISVSENKGNKALKNKILEKVQIHDFPSLQLSFRRNKEQQPDITEVTGKRNIKSCSEQFEQSPLSSPDRCHTWSNLRQFDALSMTSTNSRGYTNSIYNFANRVRDVIKRGQVFGRRKRDRLIQKDGTLNLLSVNVKKKSFRFLGDMFTTLVEAKWGYVLLFLASAFLGTWIGFALIWWGLVHFTLKDDGPICVDGVYDFTSALLFSVETQHTIGYGTRAVTTECGWGVFFVMMQSLIGVTMSCVTTGLVFAKFARPKRRAETLMFSKRAVIYEENGQRYLGIRLGDIRRRNMIQVVVQAVMFSHGVSNTNEKPFEQHNLNVGTEAGNLYFLAWPITIHHTIDKSSPLWDLSEESLLDADFEIVVIFEGTNSSTGQSTQICTSYLPSEILWGQKFVPLITSRKESGKYLIDYMKFNSTVSAPLSQSSAKRSNSVKKRAVNDDANLIPIPEIKVSMEEEV